MEILCLRSKTNWLQSIRATWAQRRGVQLSRAVICISRGSHIQLNHESGIYSIITIACLERWHRFRRTRRIRCRREKVYPWITKYLLQLWIKPLMVSFRTLLTVQCSQLIEEKCPSWGKLNSICWRRQNEMSQRPKQPVETLWNLDPTSLSTYLSIHLWTRRELWPK